MFKFALRNVFRNKKRSFITALAIFFGAMVSAFAIAWVNGMLGTMVDTSVNYMYGNVRITTQKYEDYEKFMPVDEYMPKADELIAEIKEIEGVEAVEQRIKFGIILGNNDKTEAAVGMGLDIKNNHFNLEDELTEGIIQESGIYIGNELADKLKINVGDELMIASQTSEGGLNAIKLTVAGIFEFGLNQFDKKFFLIGLEDARKLLKIDQGSTEIYVFTEDNEITDQVLKEVQQIISDDKSAKSFKELMGPLYETVETYRPVFSLFSGIIIFLASFVVINTMMMAIFERMHEIGTLKAIGFKDRQLFFNFTLEGAIIGSMGGIPGSIVGYIIIVILSKTGIDLEAMMSTVDFPMKYIIYPEATFSTFIAAILMSMIIPALAAMIPARKAGKLTPSEALRK